MHTIYSVGRTPEEAIRALCKALLSNFDGSLEELPEDPLDPSPYTWGYRFVADGTSCKAAGIHVPGGVICTWWK